jgi:hypothetical protein
MNGVQLSGPEGKWPARCWGVIAGVVTFGVQLLQVRWWSPRLPIADEWQTIKIFGPAGRSGVRPSMVWEQHNEHRIVVANAVFLVVRRFGGWVVLAPHIVSAALAALTVAVLVVTLLRLQMSSSLVVLAVATAMSPLQWENTVWGFQVQFWALVAGVVIPLCAIARRPVLDRRSLAWMIASGLWCSASLSGGLLVWPVMALVAVMLIVAGATMWSRRQSVVAAAVVLGTGLVTVVVYRIGYRDVPRPGNGGVVNQLRWTGRALVFPMVGFNSPDAGRDLLPIGEVLGGVVGALTIGALIVFMTSLWQHRTDSQRLGRFVIASGLVLWALTQIAAIGYARAAGDAIASRYASILLWVAVAAVVAFDRSVVQRVRFGSFAAALVLGLVVVQHLGLVRGVPGAARSWSSRATLDTTIDFFDRGLDGPVASPNPYANERVFGELLRESQSKGWIGQLPDDVLTQLRWKPSAEPSDSWRRGGAYPGSGVPPSLWASWNGSDDRTGTLLSQPIRVISDEVRVRSWSAVDLRLDLVLVDADDPARVLARFGGTPTAGAEVRRSTWRATTRSLLGRDVRLRATDRAQGFGGWFAIEPPTQPSRLARRVDTLIGWSPMIVIIGLAGAAAMVIARSGSTAPMMIDAMRGNDDTQS